MNTNCKKFFLCLLMVLTAAMANAAEKPTKIYIYGFSASFNDSTVYFTDIMELDSAWINTKNKFLYERNSYSYQLKNYLHGQGVEAPTCIVSYALTRKDAENKYVKLKRKYTDKKYGYYVVKYIPTTDFQFEAISAASDNEASAAQEKAAKKERKEAMKQQKRQGKAPGRRPDGPAPR